MSYQYLKCEICSGLLEGVLERFYSEIKNRFINGSPIFQAYLIIRQVLTTFLLRSLKKAREYWEPGERGRNGISVVEAW